MTRLNLQNQGNLEGVFKNRAACTMAFQGRRMTVLFDARRLWKAILQESEDTLLGDLMLRSVLIVVLCLCASTTLAHESPIDHVDRKLRLSVDGDKLLLTYQLRLTQRAALLQLRSMDSDKNGRISENERDKFFQKTSRRLAKLIDAELDHGRLTFEPVGKVRLAADFSQTFQFAAPLGKLDSKKTREGVIRDRHSRSYPGSFVFQQQRPTGNERVLINVLEESAAKRLQSHAGMLVFRFQLRVRDGVRE